MHAFESEVNRVTSTIHLSISLEKLKLPDEFFPAHLPVALIDAVFRSRDERGDPAGPAAERYCRRFDLARTSADRWEPPPAEKQETLADLIRRYDEIGMERMITTVFRAGKCSAGKGRARAECVLRAATEFRRIGINVLQDLPARSPDEIEKTLRCSVGLRESTVRMLLMYTGKDDFVRGDRHVRRFVADAIGTNDVSAAMAEELVRRSAHELIVSPRYLDNEIWRYRLMQSALPY